MDLEKVQSNYKVSYQSSQTTQPSQPSVTTASQPSAPETVKPDSSSSQNSNNTSAILELKNSSNVVGNILDEKVGDKSEKKGEKSEKQVNDAVSEINKKIKESHQELQMSRHNVTKAIMVKLVNVDTKEVIREFPPEKIQDMIAKMWEMAGIIVDEKR